MANKHFEIESVKPFSESLIWQLSRDYYNKESVGAWREDAVPHHLTSNSMVGKTYAELIFSFLKDLAAKGQTRETIYILELGAGHGRLAFHILKHLERLMGQAGLQLPPYCYVVSDIVEGNLDFFLNHDQFQPFLEKKLLDVAYFDGVESKEILLRHSGDKISSKDLDQPLIAIANYFFDSIPSDLFHFKNKKISTCSVALETEDDPKEMDEATLLKEMKLSFHTLPMKSPFYEEPILNEIMEDYRDLLFDTYLLFPHTGLQCIHNLQQLSKKGVMIISMDKGFHEIHDLENAEEPEMITHGSMSFWVNYHAYGAFCEKHGGTTFFPSFSNFYLELGCFLFLPESESYTETKAAYQRFVNDFGPDDFNGFKRFAYRHMSKMNLAELIGMLRLSAYDSTLFIKLLPHLKQTSQQITFNERLRLAQTMHQTWNMYFTLNESFDLAFEIGGVFYDLGFYRDALNYFQFSMNLCGNKADTYYNKALCYYQLREDTLFLNTIKEAKKSFPTFEKFKYLDSLNLQAV